MTCQNFVQGALKGGMKGISIKIFSNTLEVERLIVPFQPCEKDYVGAGHDVFWNGCRSRPGNMDVVGLESQRAKPQMAKRAY